MLLDYFETRPHWMRGAASQIQYWFRFIYRTTEENELIYRTTEENHVVELRMPRTHAQFGTQKRLCNIIAGKT